MQIGFLGRDMNYGFNLQEARYLQSIIPLKVGDDLVVECTYNTTNRTNVTPGGLSAMDEMCLVFLFYYPRNNISASGSFPNPFQVAMALGLHPLNYPDNLNSLSWTPKEIELAQVATVKAEQTLIVQFYNESFLMESGMLLNITAPATPSCSSSESTTMATTTTTVGSGTPGIAFEGILSLTLLISVGLSLMGPFYDF